MRIVATKTDIGNLEPGDIYSEAGPGEWAMLSEGWDERLMPKPPSMAVVGHLVFMRSNDPLPETAGHRTVYRLDVMKED